MNRPHQQPATNSAQIARNRGLTTLIRMAIQDAIREEREAMAEEASSKAAQSKQNEAKSC